MEQDPLIRQKQIEEELKRLAEEDKLGQERIINAERVVREATEALRAAGASPEEERDVFGAPLGPEEEKSKGPRRRLISGRGRRFLRTAALAGGLAASTSYLIRTGQKKGIWKDLGTQVVALKNRVTGKRERASVSPAAIRIAKYIGLDDVTKLLSDVVNDKKIGLDRIVKGIIYNEGGSPEGVINNRGNIKYIGAPGQKNSNVEAADGGTFASYDTEQDGENAISALVIAAAERGETFAYFIGRYTGTGGGENIVRTARSPVPKTTIPIPSREEPAQEEEQRPSPLVTRTQPEKSDTPATPTPEQQPPAAPDTQPVITEDTPPPEPEQPSAPPEKPKEEQKRKPRLTTAPVRVTTGTRVQMGTTVHLGGSPDAVEALRKKIKEQMDAGEEPTGAVEVSRGQGGSNIYFDTGAVDREILERANKILKEHPEFRGNPFFLTPAELLKVYGIYQKDIEKMFENHDDGLKAWEEMRKLKANEFMGREKSDPNDRIMRYLQKLQEVTNSKPDKKETVDQYMAHALQKAMKGGKIDEVIIK
ncbi:hypothetical protein A3A95_00200 [Candidatus Nomurabacteria bacterium RIFCSPLOWO2_01_FULL_39_18]|uniref:Uncharacterized protein n=1 Tax=Candidatus Nomurabacteria bacterium RIFCSPHIGHO2_01_FULL_40_24b TaxID=1801739 RepID=A0A1F6V8Y3_9BACT|nr:MAG: hypothetical protein A2647_03050 [Candidatus Nomurabacteria bacterium RIFCSPHIGHO2_01_FULL_40_24b]OGI90499.1 MAG: hypothetical protein A3A95_00200 [Candidatus Nomurabacteria bacterium RIFCSPLOWO2_01_FULL_39_18]